MCISFSVKCGTIIIYIRIILFSFLMETESAVINGEILFIQIHNINFRKLIGGRGCKAEASPRAPNNLAPAQSRTPKRGGTLYYSDFIRLHA
jgi:hypothetical protein